MAGDAVAKIKKPQLRGLLHSQIKTNLYVGIGLCIIGGVAWKFLISDPRKARFAEFYKDYDPYKEFETMRKKGVFDSC